jgi:hypothetical protein
LERIPEEEHRIRIQIWNEAYKRNPKLWPVNEYSADLESQLDITIDLPREEFADLCFKAAAEDPEVCWYRKRKTLAGLLHDNLP